MAVYTYMYVVACLSIQSSLGLLLSTNLKVLASLDGMHMSGLATLALQVQHNLLGCLGFLMEHWLGLTSETCLLFVVTTLSLSIQRGLSSLVLGDLMHSVLLALFALAIGLLRLWNVDLHMENTW